MPYAAYPKRAGGASDTQRDAYQLRGISDAKRRAVAQATADDQGAVRFPIHTAGPFWEKSLSRGKQTIHTGKADLAAVGIDMTIKQCDWNVFLQERKNGNFDFAREGWIADFNDPINMLEMWITESGNNDCQYGR